MNTNLLLFFIAVLFFIGKYLLGKLTNDPNITLKYLFSDTCILGFCTYFAFFLNEQLEPFLSSESTLVNQLPEIFLTEPEF
jgi:hypothetical protein